MESCKNSLTPSEPPALRSSIKFAESIWYLLHQHTKRAVILYATKWTQPDPNVPPPLLSITDEDLQALMEVIHGVTESDLDLILHSPGGSLDATEAFVTYLRSKFSHIRVRLCRSWPCRPQP